MYLRQAGLTRNPTFLYLYCVRCRGQDAASKAPLERKYSRCAQGAKTPGQFFHSENIFSQRTVEFVDKFKIDNLEQQMKNSLPLAIVFYLILIGCQDRESNKCGCSGINTIRTNSSNTYATIIETTDGFQIFSDQDGFLLPCKGLDPAFEVNGKPVLISGQIKLSCKKVEPNFPINPVQFDNIIPLDYKYNRLDITLTIIKSEDYGYPQGFGFLVEDKRTVGGTSILQATIPIEGIHVYDTKLKAYLNGLLVVYAVRSANTEISQETLKYIKVLN
jgi:hypothetical protein